MAAGGKRLKFPNLIFLTFGGGELASGLMGLTFSLADYEAVFNITPLADPAVMIFMKGFSCTLFCLGLQLFGQHSARISFSTLTGAPYPKLKSLTPKLEENNHEAI